MVKEHGAPRCQNSLRHRVDIASCRIQSDAPRPCFLNRGRSSTLPSDFVAHPYRHLQLYFHLSPSARTQSARGALPVDRAGLGLLPKQVIERSDCRRSTQPTISKFGSKSNAAQHGGMYQHIGKGLWLLGDDTPGGDRNSRQPHKTLVTPESGKLDSRTTRNGASEMRMQYPAGERPSIVCSAVYVNSLRLQYCWMKG